MCLVSRYTTETQKFYQDSQLSFQDLNLGSCEHEENSNHLTKTFGVFLLCENDDVCLMTALLIFGCTGNTTTLDAI